MACGSTPDMIRPAIRLQGIAPASPLGRLFARETAAIASLMPSGDPMPAAARWRRTVSGGAAQWWDDTPAARAPQRRDAGGAADILVACFGAGSQSAAAGRIWRLMDGDGRWLLDPFGFLECCQRAPFLAHVVLAEQQGGKATVLATAHLSTRCRYRELLDRVARAAVHLVAASLCAASPPSGAVASPAPRRMHRSAAAIALGRGRVAAARTASTLRNWTLRADWAIGILNAGPDVLLQSRTLTPDRWIRPAVPHTYFADPFAWPGRPDVLLCESFDHRAHLGELHALMLQDGKLAEDRRMNLPLPPLHLSYPFTFREAGRVFLLPEMEAAARMALFELHADGRIAEICTVARNVRAADATLFVRNGRYWIAYSDAAMGVHDNLCLLYADALSGPWRPHRLNPVKIDIRSARPAGAPFVVGGNLFRPAQDCSVTYGGAVTVNLVHACTPERYAEETVAVLRPDPHGPFPHGLHTVTCTEGRIVIDGLRQSVDPRQFCALAAGALRRMLARHRAAGHAALAGPCAS